MPLASYVSPELAAFMNGLPLWFKVLWAAGCGSAVLFTAWHNRPWK